MIVVDVGKEPRWVDLPGVHRKVMYLSKAMAERLAPVLGEPHERSFDVQVLEPPVFAQDTTEEVHVEPEEDQLVTILLDEQKLTMTLGEYRRRFNRQYPPGYWRNRCGSHTKTLVSAHARKAKRKQQERSRKKNR